MMSAEPGYARLGEDEQTTVQPPLYEDRYLAVTRAALIIKRFYFPTLSARAIPWTAIEWVRLARDADVKWYELKMWGMGVGTIWWNCRARALTWDGGPRLHGMGEILATNVVVKVKGAWIRPGSFVEQPEAAMAAIGQLIYRSHAHSE
ncbi:hypothetical protein IWW51_003308 [Coemansia sp. RSA 2702]|nr:hypothetical protein IWW51_003308 [Coemansia sp. RSA 2702]